MKVAYTDPAKDELYAISRKVACRIARAICPELPLLAFQTMRGPKMARDIPYFATFSSSYVRLLSVPPQFLTADLLQRFCEIVLPSIFKTVGERRRNPYFWPSVVVGLDGVIYEISCSEGGLFPSQEEMMRAIKKNARKICSYGSPQTSE